MKYYNIETRNEAGMFYRTEDWSVEKVEGWLKNNFTTKAPPADIACDFINDEWVIDPGALFTKLFNAMQDEAGARLNEVDATLEMRMDKFHKLSTARQDQLGVYKQGLRDMNKTHTTIGQLESLSWPILEEV